MFDIEEFKNRVDIEEGKNVLSWMKEAILETARSEFLESTELSEDDKIQLCMEIESILLKDVSIIIGDDLEFSHTLIESELRVRKYVMSYGKYPRKYLIKKLDSIKENIAKVKKSIDKRGALRMLFARAAHTVTSPLNDTRYFSRLTSYGQLSDLKDERDAIAIVLTGESMTKEDGTDTSSKADAVKTYRKFLKLRDRSTKYYNNIKGRYDSMSPTGLSMVSTKLSHLDFWNLERVDDKLFDLMVEKYGSIKSIASAAGKTRVAFLTEVIDAKKKSAKYVKHAEKMIADINHKYAANKETIGEWLGGAKETIKSIFSTIFSPKSAAYIGVGLAVSSIVFAAYYAWKKRSQNCTKKKGNDKTKCEIGAVDRALDETKKRMSDCVKTVNPSKCREELKDVLEKWEDRKEELSSQLDNGDSDAETGE